MVQFKPNLILEIIKNLQNCSNPVTTTTIVKSLSFSLISVWYV